MSLAFYHITDTHYFSHKNYEGDPFALEQFHDQIAMRESPEIIESVFDEIVKDKETNTVIFTGDMTHHGDEASHYEMLKLLDKLEKAGKQVIAFTDFHDYPDDNFGFSVDKDGNHKPKKPMKKEDVLKLYAPYGIDKAIAVYKDDFSFVAQLPGNVRYIAMSYVNLGNGPELIDEYMQWINEQVQLAKRDGQVVIAGIHPPFICPSPVYNILGKGNTVYEYEKRGKELADIGINLVLSGHSHIQDISYLISEKGNPFYNVTTSSLVGYPPKYRKITLDTEKRKAEIITLIPQVPKLNLNMPLIDYCREGFLGGIAEIPYYMEHDVNALSSLRLAIPSPAPFCMKHKIIAKCLGKFLSNLTFGKLGKWTKNKTCFNKNDYKDIKNEKVVSYALETFSNLYQGNADTLPETVKYKIIIATFEKIDLIIKIFRINLKKLTGYNTVKSILEPLIYNSGIDDDNTVLDLNNSPIITYFSPN
jgi:hypothetical protein